MSLENLNETLVCVDEDGRVFRLNLKPHEITINEDALFASLRENQSVRIPNAMFVGKQPVGLNIRPQKDGQLCIDATVPLPFVRFNTGFRVVEDGKVVVPVFEKPKAGLPRLCVDWDVREACSGKIKLWLLVQTYTQDNLHVVGKCWLAATSCTNKTYRIPLSNVYDDCQICMGDEWDKGSQPTLQNALDEALHQFLNSPWNSDLRKSTEKSDAFFRFQPENEGFKTLPVVGQWNNLCERVTGIPALDFLLLPPPEREE